MKTHLSRALAWLIDQALCLLVSLLTGIRPQTPPFAPKQCIYYANHSSHGDFLLVWVSLPQAWRTNLRPVAGADYWQGTAVKRFISRNVFNALLIERHSGNPQAAGAQLDAAVKAGHSLIIFPEGTRNTDDTTALLPFKSGLFHLAAANPDIALVPVWINNINRVLPKGKILPVPLLCDLRIGETVRLHPFEDKESFLNRARSALLHLAPADEQQKDREPTV